jgi:hypothetical protein
VGVESLDGGLARVRVKFKTLPLNQVKVGNELRRRLMVAFVGRGIKPYAKYGEKKLRFNWNAPIQLSPTDKNTLYIGSQFLYRSRNHGQSWERISPDLTTNEPEKQKQEESGGTTIDNSAAEMNTTIYTIAESPARAQVIWVGTDDGNVQVTEDGGKSWTNVKIRWAWRAPMCVRKAVTIVHGHATHRHMWATCGRPRNHGMGARGAASRPTARSENCALSRRSGRSRPAHSARSSLWVSISAAAAGRNAVATFRRSPCAIWAAGVRPPTCWHARRASGSSTTSPRGAAPQTLNATAARPRAMWVLDSPAGPRR